LWSMKNLENKVDYYPFNIAREHWTRTNLTVALLNILTQEWHLDLDVLWPNRPRTNYKSWSTLPPISFSFFIRSLLSYSFQDLHFLIMKGLQNHILLLI
jgi:hypothetical protein